MCGGLEGFVSEGQSLKTMVLVGSTGGIRLNS